MNSELTQTCGLRKRTTIISISNAFIRKICHHKWKYNCVKTKLQPRKYSSFFLQACMFYLILQTSLFHPKHIYLSVLIFSTIVIRDAKIFPSSLIFFWGSIFYTIRLGVHSNAVLYLRNLTRITINTFSYNVFQCSKKQLYMKMSNQFS